MLRAILLTSVAVLLIYSVYERAQWEEDYSLYEAPTLSFPPFDIAFEAKINSSTFDNSIVISDNELLAFPEDLAVGRNGTIYTGMNDGSILQIDSTGKINTLHKNNETGGVFGIILSQNESELYYVSEFQGLSRLNIATKRQQNLLPSLEGRQLKGLNNLCLDESTGTIYITESTPFAIRHAGKDILLKHQKGRILFYNIHSRQSGVFAEHLAYPNGIVFEESTRSVIFSELSHYRISKISLQSPTKKLTLVDNLFGYPDNLELNSKGQLYVGIPAVRDQSVEYLNQQPQIRKWLMFVPEAILPLSLRKVAGGIKVDTKSGAIKEYIFGDTSVIHSVTTLLQRNGLLYMSSLTCPTIVVLGRQGKIGQEGSQSLEKRDGNVQESQQL